MSSMILYIGSEHVIQEPHFDVMKGSLRAETDRSIGVQKACQRFQAGVLNSYSLNLQPLTIINGSESEQVYDADVVMYENSDDHFVSIRSTKALKQLRFLGATFVSRANH